MVDVRTDTAARCGTTDHEIVNTPIRDEIDLCEVDAEIGQVLFYIVYQQRPVPRRQSAQCVVVERTRLDPIAGAIVGPVGEYEP